MTSASRHVTIINNRGLHARASNAFAKLASTFSSAVKVNHNSEEANAGYIMDLLMLAAHKGCEIEIKANGADAEQAVDALAELVADGFGELAADKAAAEAERTSTSH